MQRIKFLKYAIFTMLGIIVVRLFFIQIIEHNDWVSRAAEQQTLLETIEAKRGDIYMMEDGEPVKVVMNQTVYSVVIDPQITNKDDLKELLNQYAKDYITVDIDKVYEIEGLRYSVVAKNLTRDIALKLNESGVAGIWLKESSKRVYPEGEMAAQLLGFVNVDGEGQYGVEGALNERLAGTDGLIKTISDVNDVALSIGADNVKIAAQDGENLVLTINRGLQKRTEEILAKSIKNTIATNAAAVIIDPNTGEVLTMANVPTYDPAKYESVADWTSYVNYVTDIPYEPASVCKTFVFAAALNEGAMTPDSVYYNTGSTVIDTATIHNATLTSNVYGNISMRTALNYSLNTGSIQALKWLGGDANNINEKGRQKLYEYYGRFGLGEKTGIEISEAEGVVHEPDYGWTPDLTYAEMTFGQATSLTMIQLASAYSTVVNGGYRITPTVVKGTIENGELKPAPFNSDENVKQVISNSVSSTLRQMLIDTRTVYLKRDSSAYALGGKTGTGQVYLESTGAYSAPDGETTATYAGFGGTPGELPKYVIIVKMWGEGQHVDGSTDAKKVFDEISDATIDYLKIKPKE